MYQREQHWLVAHQILAQLGRVLWLAFFLFAYHLRSYKRLVYLGVKIVAVGYYQERKVSMQLTSYLPYKHYHRVAFTRALCMPEHTQLSVKLFATLYTLHQIINTQELVVFSNNLGAFVVEEDKVLDIVYQSFFLKQSVYQVLYRQAMLSYLVSIQFFLLVINTQPLKKVFVASTPSTYLGLQSVRKHANLIQGKDIGYILR